MRYLNFSGQTGTMDDMTHELDRLLDQRLDGRVNLVLMLDGLNEAQESGKNLLPEIEELSRKSGVSILVTDRSDEVLQYALSGFKSAVLKPLNSRAVQAALAAGHVKSPRRSRLGAAQESHDAGAIYPGGRIREAGWENRQKRKRF